MDERLKNNLMTFLDRVEYKGLQEVEAINEIIAALNNITVEDKAKEGD